MCLPSTNLEPTTEDMVFQDQLCITFADGRAGFQHQLYDTTKIPQEDASLGGWTRFRLNRGLPLNVNPGVPLVYSWAGVPDAGGLGSLGVGFPCALDFSKGRSAWIETREATWVCVRNPCACLPGAFA